MGAARGEGLSRKRWPWVPPEERVCLGSCGRGCRQRRESVWEAVAMGAARGESLSRKRWPWVPPEERVCLGSGGHGCRQRRNALLARGALWGEVAPGRWCASVPCEKEYPLGRWWAWAPLEGLVRPRIHAGVRRTWSSMPRVWHLASSRTVGTIACPWRCGSMCRQGLVANCALFSVWTCACYLCAHPCVWEGATLYGTWAFIPTKVPCLTMHSEAHIDARSCSARSHTKRTSDLHPHLIRVCILWYQTVALWADCTHTHTQTYTHMNIHAHAHSVRRAQLWKGPATFGVNPNPNPYQPLPDCGGRGP